MPDSEAAAGAPTAGAAMEKRFDPASYETRWQAWWEEQDLFRCPGRIRTVRDPRPTAF